MSDRGKSSGNRGTQRGGNNSRTRGGGRGSSSGNQRGGVKTLVPKKDVLAKNLSLIFPNTWISESTSNLLGVGKLLVYLKVMIRFSI
ncbi:hypothetical protein DSO57_1032709 [Entomophthora muscae]|uniref:Uncharacterized protein n=1 Tax=Entomophthora muscae TaxID=34485 RepID=A0ACC2U9Z8_9FUNG|nr:hypothetical protein DSO57_1032709 [Entomophthora muscae]